MFCAAEISAVTSSYGSVRHQLRSANCSTRRASDSPIDANRRAIAADSSRVASPMASISAASVKLSNMCSIMPRRSDKSHAPAAKAVYKLTRRNPDAYLKA